MAKGIVVLDKVPHTCQHIRGNEEDGCPFGGMVCQICDKDVMEHTVHGTKPDWCPVQELPKRRAGYLIDTERHKDNYKHGWNACLDEIEGSAEK